jgi:hypothetical protein
MKDAIKWFGIIALVAVIGFSMAACDGDDDNGGGDQIWSKLKDTVWDGELGSTTANLEILFAENAYFKMIDFSLVGSSDPQANGYAAIEVEANKFICFQDDYTIDYVLSNDGKKLTLSNIGKDNKKQYEGAFTKK